MKTLFAFLITIIGEALVIGANIILFPTLPTDILALNCVVCSIIFLMIIWPLWGGLIDKQDKHEKWVATLGLGIAGFNWYCLLALAAIVCMNVGAFRFVHAGDLYEPLKFGYQLMIHLALLLVLLLTFWASHRTGEQVSEVYVKEKSMTAGVDEMRRAVRNLQDQLFVTDGIDPAHKQIVYQIEENLRFISPIGNDESRELEKKFVDIIAAMIPAFHDYRMNHDSIDRQLKLLMRTFENRKNVRL